MYTGWIGREWGGCGLRTANIDIFSIFYHGGSGNATGIQLLLSFRFATYFSSLTVGKRLVSSP